jgi:DNA repair protein RadC
MRHERIAWTVRLDAPGAATALLRPEFAGLRHEELRVLYLDAVCLPIALTAERGHDPQRVDVPLRQVVAEALALDAHGLILAHNHPGGDSSPSAADRAVTRRLAEVVGPLGIRLVDHLVFAGARVASFRQLGLL